MFQSWKNVEEQQVLYVIKNLKTLFADKNTWIDWPIAVDLNGNEVSPLSLKATKWSLIGASTKIAAEKYNPPLSDYVDCATREFLLDLSDDNSIGKLVPYDDEYALICLGYEYLTKENK